MAGNRKLKIIFRKLGDTIYVDANVVVNGRKLMRWILFFGLVIVLILLAARGDPAIDWKEFLLGLIQSVVVDYLNRK